MGFKRGLLIGFGAGYVLGARAGRERYEQIVDTWNRVTGSPRFQQATERTKEVAGKSAQRGMHVVQRGVERAGSAVKDRLGREDRGGEAADMLTMDEIAAVEPAPDLVVDHVEPMSDVVVREEVVVEQSLPGEEPAQDSMRVDDLEEQAASEPDAQLPPEEYRREGDTSL